MSTIDLLSADGAKGGTVDLPGDLFDQTTNIPLIHQVVTAQMAAARQGTAATKTRGLVRGGGIKPWRQKGTGRARQGSRRAPQWVGGGTVHGPQPRDYAQKTPKRMIQAALLGTLSDRAREGRVFVFDAIVKGDVPSTRQAAINLAPLAEYRNLLIVLDRDDYAGWLSLRNLPAVHIVSADQLNAYDVVVADAVIFTRAAIEVFAAAKGSAVVVKADGDASAEADVKPAEKTAAKAAEPAEEAPEVAEAEAAEKPVEAAAEKVADAEAAEKPAKAAAKKVAEKVADAGKVADEAEAEVKPAKATAKKATAEVTEAAESIAEKPVKAARSTTKKVAAKAAEVEAEAAPVEESAAMTPEELAERAQALADRAEALAKKAEEEIK